MRALDLFCGGGALPWGLSKLAQWQEAMQIDWIKSKWTIAQCVPPAYSCYIGKAFIEGMPKTEKEGNVALPLALAQTQNENIEKGATTAP